MSLYSGGGEGFHDGGGGGGEGFNSGDYNDGRGKIKWLFSYNFWFGFMI